MSFGFGRAKHRGPAAKPKKAPVHAPRVVKRPKPPRKRPGKRR